MANQISAIESDEETINKPHTQDQKILKMHFASSQIIETTIRFMEKVDSTFVSNHVVKPKHPLELINDEIDTDEPFNAILKCSELLFVYCKYYKYIWIWTQQKVEK